MVATRPRLEPGLQFESQQNAAKSVKAVRTLMLLNEPEESFFLGQLIFETVEGRQCESTGNFPSGVSVEDGALVRDLKRLPKERTSGASERRYSGGWYRDAVAKVTWVRTQFVHTACNEAALTAVAYGTVAHTALRLSSTLWRSHS